MADSSARVPRGCLKPAVQSALDRLDEIGHLLPPLVKRGNRWQESPGRPRSPSTFRIGASLSPGLLCVTVVGLLFILLTADA